LKIQAKRLAACWLIISFLSFAFPTLVQAFPPLPSSFYGVVRLDGGNLPEGTLVEALIDGQVFASTTPHIYEGESVYQLIVPGDDPSTTTVEGGHTGDVINFRVAGIMADQTGTWQSGTNISLDLDVVSNQLNPTPTKTLSPQLSPTSPLLFPSPTSLVYEPLTPTPVEQNGETATSESNAKSEISPSPASSEEALLETNEPTTQGQDETPPKIEETELASGEKSDRQVANKLWFGIPILLIVLILVGWLYFRKKNESDLL
jgi:hypothetical protein